MSTTSKQGKSATEALKNSVAPSAEKPAMTPYQQLSHALEARRAHFKQLLGSDEAASRFIRVVLTAAQHNPELVTADARTMLVACMKAAMDGLMPDGREAVLNIYSTKMKGERGDYWIKAVQYLPMVGGILKKLWESGLFSMLDGVVVYDRDTFKYQRGDEPKIEHVPYGGQDDPGEITAAYFIAKLKNGEVKREVMWRRDIEKVRNASKAPDGLMWKTFYDQGAIKSVIKRAYKQLPSTQAMEQLIGHDNEAMGFTPMSTLDILPFEAPQPPAPPQLPEHAQAGGVPLEGMTIPQREEATVMGEVKPNGKHAPAEPNDIPADKGIKYEVLRERITGAVDLDLLEADGDLIREVQDEKKRALLTEMYNAKREALIGGGA